MSTVPALTWSKVGTSMSSDASWSRLSRTGQREEGIAPASHLTTESVLERDLGSAFTGVASSVLVDEQVD